MATFDHFVDAILLQIYFISDIDISNCILMHKLYQKRCKSRAGKFFIILNCSDIGVGLFSIFFISIPLFKWNVSAINYMHDSIWIFTACFPYSFLWILVMTTALDKASSVPKGQINKNCTTMKVLYRVITIRLLFVLAIVILLAMRHNSFKGHTQVIVF